LLVARWINGSAIAEFIEKILTAARP